MSDNAANSVTLRFLAAPTDVGHSGSVDAGTVLEWVDKAAYAAAVGWASSSSRAARRASWTSGSARKAAARSLRMR